MPIWAGESAPNRKDAALSSFSRTIRGTNIAPRHCGGYFQQGGRKGKAAHPLSVKGRERPGAAFSCLLEQLRTIDKKRLETYIGRLEEKHIRRINHALAVSVGLIEEVPEI